MITRDIYINSTQVTPPIRIVYGTDNLPVQFCMKDVTLASGNTAKFYSLAPSENRYEQTGTINTTDQTITFTPEAGFFETGQNLLQCEITQSGKVIYSFVVDVLCGLNVMAEGTAAEAVNVKMWGERAEAAAETAEAIADNMGSAFPTAEISGSITDVGTFTDGADGIPMKSVIVSIEPIQAGSGDPSPINERPISGTNSVAITRTNKNLVDPDLVLKKAGIDQETGEFTTTTSYACSNYIDVSGIDAVTVRYYKSTSGGQYFRIARYNANKVLIDFDIKTTQSGIGEKKREVDTSQCAYIAVMIGNVNIDSLVVCETYDTFARSFGQTVYGCIFNPLTGVLTVKYAGIDLGTLSWQASSVPNGIYATPSDRIYGNNASGIIGLCEQYSFYGNASKTGLENNLANLQFGFRQDSRIIVFRNDSYQSVDDFAESLNGVKLVYPIAPTEIQLTPLIIPTVYGENNIWVDAGEVSVVYRADPTLYLDGKLEPIKGFIASEECGDTAGKAYSAGEYFLHDNQLCKALTGIESGATLTLNTNYAVTTIGAELYSALNA